MIISLGLGKWLDWFMKKIVIFTIEDVNNLTCLSYKYVNKPLPITDWETNTSSVRISLIKNLYSIYFPSPYYVSCTASDNYFRRTLHLYSKPQRDQHPFLLAPRFYFCLHHDQEHREDSYWYFFLEILLIARNILITNTKWGNKMTKETN